MRDRRLTGRKLRILTVADTHARYCPMADPRFADGGGDVVQPLARGCRQVGDPQTIRVDNGSDFTSRDLHRRAEATAVTLDLSRPGKPTDHGFIAAFNRKLRAEHLNAQGFLSLPESRGKSEPWRRDDNDGRPHRAIRHRAPSTLHNPGWERPPVTPNSRKTQFPAVLRPDLPQAESAPDHG
jgi:putative transposase